MKSGTSTRRSRIVLPTGSAGLAADARATRQAVLTMMAIPVYGDGKTPYMTNRLGHSLSSRSLHRRILV